ncbi:MAG: hypothetical protein HZA16_12815 [Nitrospirae bacterium]|nr:hypothetical protein [Nitrospirota bacterium]
MKYGVQGSRVSRGRGGAGLISKPVIHLLLIAVLGLIVYSNTFHSPFQWDEAVYIVDNLSVRDLSSFMDPSSVPGMNPYSFKNRYIGYLTFALNYRLHGFDVTGYHVVNLAIHITNAVLVYFMVLLTLRTPYFEGQGARGKAQRA